MKNRLVTTLAAVCLAVAGMGNLSAQYRGVVEPRSDDPAVAPASEADSAVTLAVKRALESDGDLRGSKIVVNAQDGSVTLTGTVPTDDAKEVAQYVAGRAKGVTKVVNRVRVKGRVT